MQLRGNRKAERAAVNATQTFFEENDFVFQEVDTGNDYGKDAYVDLTAGTAITGFMVALQIKGGVSYKRPGGYGIPLDSHEAVWRGSTVPVGGIVHDPGDGLLRWCNISQFLDEHPISPGSYVPVPADQVLTQETAGTAFKDSFQKFWDRRSSGLSLLRLCTENEDEQIGALLDCFAYGRHDARLLIVLRYMLKMLRGDVLMHAIHILAHVTPHPDILWHKGNWISDGICRDVAQHFRWTVEEILVFFKSVPWSEWHRGGLGESIYMLLHEDPEIKPKMEQAAFAALDLASDFDGGDEDEEWDVAFGPLYLTLYWAGKKADVKYLEMLERDSRFDELLLASELMACLEEQGWLTLFE